MEIKRIEIKLGDLKSVNAERKQGFAGTNPGKPGCSAPWSTLQSIGLAIKDSKNPVEVEISCGGVRNRNISIYYADLFKKEVLPAIRVFSPECPDTFKLILHFGEGLLLKAELVYKERK